MGTTTETQTETNTPTATSGACALGAGIAAVACKGMTLGFVAGMFGLIGFTGLSSNLVMTILLVGAGVLVWAGFRHAGTKAVALGLAGLGTMWWAYMMNGLIVLGEFTGHMFDPVLWVQQPLQLAPLAALYIAGTGFFVVAAYLAYFKPMSIQVGDDSQEVAGAGTAGIAAATMCSGCGVTGVLGGVAIAGLGTAAVGSDVVLLSIFVGMLVVLAYTLYKRAWKPSALVGAGIFVSFPLPWMIVDTIITGDLLLVVGMLMTYVGLGMVFLGLYWTTRPEMDLIPSRWKRSAARPLAMVQGLFK